MSGPIEPTSRQPVSLAIIALILLGLMLALMPLLHWQQGEIAQERSLSNLRRLADSLQLYAQDYDGCLMPPVEFRKEAPPLTWPVRAQGYLSSLPGLLDNPANPVSAAPHPLTDPTHRYRIPTSYALNRRFFGVFSKGPFSLDNLELPEQTVLLVEAGPMWSHTGRGTNRTPTPHSIARLDYGDTADRVQGLVCYPSTHFGKMAVVAADGHAKSLRVAHYGSADGLHDPLYGRIGDDIYNWNGGHPNGLTDTPPHE